MNDSLLLHAAIQQGELTQESTLKELRETKERWLQEGLDTGILPDCRLIAKELGERIEHQFTTPWDQKPTYQWCREGVVITLYTDRGTLYLMSKGVYENTELLTVYVGPNQVARYVFTNNPRADISESFYVPGKWVMVIQSWSYEAAEREAARVFALQNDERQELLDQLLVGVEV